MEARTLLGRAVGLKPAQVIRIIHYPENGGVEIRGCNEAAELVVRSGLQFSPSGRLQLAPDSEALRSGAQFRFKEA